MPPELDQTDPNPTHPDLQARGDAGVDCGGDARARGADERAQLQVGQRLGVEGDERRRVDEQIVEVLPRASTAREQASAGGTATET